MEQMNRTQDPITTERLDGAPTDPTYRREAKDTVAGDDYEYPIFNRIFQPRRHLSQTRRSQTRGFRARTSRIGTSTLLPPIDE